MDGGPPAPSCHIIDRKARKLSPPLIDELQPSVRPRTPYLRGDRVDNQAKLILRSLNLVERTFQICLGLNLLSDVSRYSKDLNHLAGRVDERTSCNLQMLNGAVGERTKGLKGEVALLSDRSLPIAHQLRPL